MRKLTHVALAGVALLAIAALFSSINIPKAVAQTVRAALVKNIDEPARAPYQVYITAFPAVNSPCGSNFCEYALTPVPANKRLTITNISMRIVPAAGDITVEDVRLYLCCDASFHITSSYTLPYNANLYPPDNLTVGQVQAYVINEQLRWFVEAGQTPRLTFHTSGGDLSGYEEERVLVTGYLVDLTQ